MDLEEFSRECGWFGWSHGPDSFLEYQCGCDLGHMAYVAHDARDPEYYRILCAFIGSCRT